MASVSGRARSHGAARERLPLSGDSHYSVKIIPTTRTSREDGEAGFQAPELNGVDLPGDHARGSLNGIDVDVGPLVSTDPLRHHGLITRHLGRARSPVGLKRNRAVPWPAQTSFSS